MPKLKTVKGIKDRVKVTGTGKLMARQPGRRHLLAHRRSKTKRQLRRPHLLSPADAKNIRTTLPYK